MLPAADWLGGHVGNFAQRLVCPRQASAVNKIRVEGIDGDLAVFKHTHRVPLAKRDFAVVAAAQRSCGAAFLLRPIHPVRKPIIGSHVIELGSRLVVPTAPGSAAIYSDYSALIARERDRLGVLAADPDALIIIAARRAPESHKCFSRVAGLPGGGVRDVDQIRIIGRNGNAHGTGPAATNAPVRVDETPGFSRVIGTVHARSLFCLDRGVDSMRLTRGDW